LERDKAHDKQVDSFILPEFFVKKVVSVFLAFRCSNCGKLHFGEGRAQASKAGLICFTLMAFISELKGEYSLSLRRIQKLLKNVFSLELSLGYINATLKWVSKILRPIYLEILDHVKDQLILNIDETSFRLKGRRVYTWSFNGVDIVAFKIGTRSKYVLEIVLGESFKGTIGCDFYAAYQSFIKDKEDVILQFCMAHLIRDFKYCYDFNNAAVSQYGKKAIDLLRQIFHVFHEYKELDDRNSERGLELRASLYELKDQLIKAALDVPSGCRKAQALAKRFQDPELRDYYFTFIDNPDVAPTNNAAELVIRGIVIDRKICYGVQSQEGVAFCETFWTVCKNLEQRNISVHSFITDVLKANKAGLPLPSIVNLGSSVDPKYMDQAKEEEKEFLAEKERLSSLKRSKVEKSTDPTNQSKANASEIGSPERSAHDNNTKGRATSQPAEGKLSKASPSPPPDRKVPEASPSPPPDRKVPEASPSPPPDRKAPEASPSPPPGRKTPEARSRSSPEEDQPLAHSPKPPGSSNPKQNADESTRKRERCGEGSDSNGIPVPVCRQNTLVLEESQRQALMALVRGATCPSASMTIDSSASPPPVKPLARRTPVRI
jgi:hypothetical protein